MGTSDGEDDDGMRVGDRDIVGWEEGVDVGSEVGEIVGTNDGEDDDGMRVGDRDIVG